MYRIAICDDSRRSCELLRDKLIAIMPQILSRVEVDTFTNPRSLMGKLQSDLYWYDTIFLDIEFDGSLEEKAGIELGRRIREVLKNRLVNIVYFSRFGVLMGFTFITNPFDFINKPLNDEKILDVVKRLRDNYSFRQDAFFKYTKDRMPARVPAGEIIFLTVNNRMMTMKTVRSQETFYGTLKDAYDQLSGYGFARINKNCMINVHYIAKYTPLEVRMQTDDRFIPSERGYEEIERLSDMISRQKIRYGFKDFSQIE